ncbi:pyridoxal phosphate-dependent aminotransferase [Ferroplasma acidiphilum]|uniref:pyridoxal phosphate-dependent aminotransferase n=1 Tax=Ferroplasma acidiphilum TaxID=74969 RepID=UPI002815E2BD|nr:pyridoxal phosphate-dependent aminotransferase [Ferroplasma acidiphilum]WMT53220.1 MAG: pyridoxal phosphate-dependent aminotransferase [Ferroplasma acidiphilum]
MNCETIDWLNKHSGKYELSHSGMSGVFDLKEYFNKSTPGHESDLKEQIGNLHGVDAKNVVLTHGATEAFSMVLYHLHAKYNTFIVNKPEYEMIYKTPEIFGYKEGNELFVASNPNNPTGTLIKFPDTYSSWLIDETFMEFVEKLDKYRYTNGYIVNTFTKVYGGGDLRLGYIIAPDKDEAAKLEGFKGLITEDVSWINVSAGYEILKKHDELLANVKEIINSNHKVLIHENGKLKFYGGKDPLAMPVSFVDYSGYTAEGSESVSEKLAKEGIIALPAKYFGITGPYLRVCITGKDFPEAYRALLNALEGME